MRRLLLLSVILLLAIGACKKDNDNEQCGVVFSLTPRQDGGVEENIDAQGCDDNFKRAAQQGNSAYILVFYKGQTRPKAKYLIVNVTSTAKLYIRYESGTVPDTTVAKYNLHYVTQIADLTGLERVQW